MDCSAGIEPPLRKLADLEPGVNYFMLRLGVRTVASFGKGVDKHTTDRQAGHP